MNFVEMSLPPALLSSISKMGFENPTPIQVKAIPAILSGRDTISLAETGSGKTAAYLIPVISHLLSNISQTALILAPTRELILQIAGVVRSLTQFAETFECAVVIGGAPMHKQIRALQHNPRIIVATPGRLVDHIRHKSVSLKNISHFILDEADRMFDMGFAPQVQNIVREVSRTRQTLLFSATFPDEVRKLAQRILNNPLEIEVRKNNLPPKVITQKMLSVNSGNKNNQTLDLINAAIGSTLIFTRTKHRTDKLARYLEDFGVAVTRIHGNRSQGQRNKSILGFKSGQYRVMVATDIAARGIDVTNVSDVINYDLPMTVEDYVHRIGRTGRAGQAGQAITLVTPEDTSDWYYIARKMGLPVPEGAQGVPRQQAKPLKGRPNKQKTSGKDNFWQNKARSKKPFRNKKGPTRNQPWK